MKRIKSVSVLLLALCMVSPLFLSGCRKTANSATDVEIVYWRSGLGGEWIDDVVNMFNESQSTYVAHLTSTTDGERFPNEIERGAKYNSVDLYLTGCPNFYDFIEYVEPLNSLLNSTFPLVFASQRTIVSLSASERIVRLPSPISTLNMSFAEIQ